MVRLTLASLTAAMALAITGCAGHGGRTPQPAGAAPDLSHFFGTNLVMQRSRSFGLDRIAIRPSGDARFPWMARVSYPAGSASPTVARAGAPEGGAQSYLKLRSGPADVLYLRYYVRFPAGFDFVKGGKLPGLFGGTVTSGQHIPDGADGLSTRYMWRHGGDGEVYAYLPTSVKHGTSLGRGAWTFTPGGWVCLEQGVRLNTPGHRDGEITVWIDGRQAYRSTGLTFRTSPALKIDGLFFSTFFGGDDKSWISPRDQTADFAAFAVADHRIGPVAGK